jgi:hypothetical protein
MGGKRGEVEDDGGGRLQSVRDLHFFVDGFCRLLRRLVGRIENLKQRLGDLVGLVLGHGLQRLFNLTQLLEVKVALSCKALDLQNMIQIP